ncbi:MAG: hypothetical protein P8Y10_13270 [Gemmatimonadales bacterium]|jgi:hypothetical protein
MTMQDLGGIGEFIGAIAVVLSLLYLAVQIRQNTRSVRAASNLSYARLSHDFSALLASDEKIARLYRLGLEDLTQLTEDQHVQFDALLVTLFRSWQYVYQQYSESLLAEDEWQAASRNLLWIIRQPGAEDWWKDRQAMFTDPFRCFLGERGRTGQGRPDDAA